MKSPILQIAVGALASIVFTGSAAWLVFGQDKISRIEMIDYVESQAPWVKERGEITSAMNVNSDNIGKLEKVIDKMVSSQQELIVEQRVLIERVDKLLSKDD